jgi:hypothetical protein
MSSIPVIQMSKKNFGSLHKGMIDALEKGARALLYTSGYDVNKSFESNGCEGLSLVFNRQNMMCEEVSCQAQFWEE